MVQIKEQAIENLDLYETFRAFVNFINKVDDPNQAEQG